MQAKNGSVIATVIICAAILFIGGMYAVSSVENSIPEVPEFDIPTAAEVAALIVVPSAPVVDNSKIDRVCELTDGCEFYEGNMNDLIPLNGEDAREDYEDAVSKLLDYDDDDDDETKLVLTPVTSFKDYQVRAYSDNDKDDENWELKVFIRQPYRITDDDLDVADEEHGYLYLVVTSVLDEGYYDSLSVEEVSRRFEFD